MTVWVHEEHGSATNHRCKNDMWFSLYIRSYLAVQQRLVSSIPEVLTFKWTYCYRQVICTYPSRAEEYALRWCLENEAYLVVRRPHLLKYKYFTSIFVATVYKTNTAYPNRRVCCSEELYLLKYPVNVCCSENFYRCSGVPFVFSNHYLSFTPTIFSPSLSFCSHKLMNAEKCHSDLWK